MTETYLGNGIVSQSCYDPNTLRVTAIRAYPGAAQSCVVTDPANARLSLKYQQYDNAGNVQQVNDATRTETLTYTYDDLDRLLSVSGAYSQSFSYTAIGNFVAKAGVSHTYGTQSASCPAGALSKPHAVVMAGSDTYCYDPNGNMVRRVEGGVTYTQNFDAENRLASVTVSGQTTTFVYDGDGNLVKKLKPDGTSTVYIGGIYEVDLNPGNQATKITSYYPAGGAMRVEIVGSSNTLYYMLRDHLGSASVTLDSSGNAMAEMRYYPFGETRASSGAMPTDRLFTGQRALTELGIYNYNARYYSPRLGRFLSADTIVPSPANPQALNRYSYVNNTPVNATDPSGHAACYDTDLEIGRDISQADCWAYGADKWLYNLPVAAPIAGKGYNTLDYMMGDQEAPSFDNINFVGEWNSGEQGVVFRGAHRVGVAFASVMGGGIGASEAFAAAFGEITFTYSDDRQGFFCERNAAVNGTTCYANSRGRLTEMLIAHELAHVFNATIANNNPGINNAPYSVIDQGIFANVNGQQVRIAGLTGNGYVRTDFGYRTAGIPYQQHRDRPGTRGEDFADTFMNWAFNSFTQDVYGDARHNWMTANMAVWIPLAMNR